MAKPKKTPPVKDWTSPAQADRQKKMVAVTLSDEERSILQTLSDEYGPGSKSRIVGAALRLFCEASPTKRAKAMKASSG